MTPAAAARKFDRKARVLDREADRALERTLDAGVKLGQKASSGGATYAALASAGHPYSVRRPQASFPPELVNYHRGDFQRGFQKVAPSAFGTGRHARVINNSDVAGFLLGRNRPRSRMVRRPVDDLVTEELRPVYVGNARAAVQRSVKA